MISKSALICQIEQYRSFVKDLRSSGEALCISEKMLTAWIFHESMIEGRRFDPEEISATIKNEDKKFPAYMKLVFDEVRAMQKGIEGIVQWSQQGNAVLSLPRLKAIHKLISATDAEAGNYRKNSPVHRDYQHDICQHQKVPTLLKEFFDDLNIQVENRQYDLIPLVAEVHQTLMHIYPYKRLPGSTIRLFCNLILLANDYPPVIITAQDKGDYYQAIADKNVYQITKIFQNAVERFLSLNPEFLKVQNHSKAN